MPKPAFDPNKPFEAAAKPAFDPNASFEAADEAPQPGLLSRLGNSTVDSLPVMGAATGGALGFGAAGVGAVPGAMAGGAAGLFAQKAIRGIQKNGLMSMFGAPTASGLVNETKDQIMQLPESASLEMGGQVGSKLMSKAAGLLRPGAKVASDSIKAAGQRLGIKPTAGMLSGSPTIQGMESSLEQTPSLARSLMKSETDPVRNQLVKQSEELLSDASGKSSYKTGVELAKDVSSGMGQKYQEIQMAYEPFNKELPRMAPNLEDKMKLADEVAKATKGSLSLTANLDQFGEKVANKVLESKSLADVENLRKQVSGSLSSAYRSGDGNAIDALGSLHDKLSSFRDDQFMKLAKDSYPKGGAKMGKSMAEEYKAAQGLYKNAMDELKDIGPIFGIKNKNPKAFVDAVQNIPPEQLYSKMFKPNNVEAIQKVQKYFPESFETMRQTKLQEIYNKSLDPQNRFSTQRMLSVVKKMPPEYREIVFGEKVKNLNDIQTLVNSFPDMVGPSGTAQAESYKDMLSPIHNAKQLANYGIYKTATNPTVQKAAAGVQRLAKKPGVSQAVGGLLNQGATYSKKTLGIE